MLGNYYALVAGLPDMLPTTGKVVDTSAGFREILKEEISPSDYRLVELLYLPFDHANLLNLLFKKDAAWDRRGNFPMDLMEMLIDPKSFETIEKEEVPGYFIDFLDRFHGEEKITCYYSAEHALTVSYYTFLSKQKNEFVKSITAYQRDILNVLAALKCRKFNTPLDNVLVGEDEVTSAILKNRSRDFGLSIEMPDIELLVQLFENPSILDREFKLDLHKWNFIDEITFFNYFSIEKILAFILKLFIVERWIELEPAKGNEMFTTLLNDLCSGFKLPAEFTLIHGKKE